MMTIGSKGPKTSVDPPLDISRGSGAHKTHSSSSGTNGDRKRDAPGSGSPSASLAKKPKLTLVLSASGSREEAKKERDVPRSETWDSLAIEGKLLTCIGLLIFDVQPCDSLGLF